MPLQDHFHPPLSLRRHWHAFHNAWATYIASALNQQLPPVFFAELDVQFGSHIETGGIVEIGIYHPDQYPPLLGAVELVNPGNKDRAEHREAFVSKCISYLQQVWVWSSSMW
jgi:hypothetical protein